MQLKEDQTEIQSHLTIVGAILESSDIYRSKRQELLRELVLRAIQELEKSSVANAANIFSVICYKDLNLLKKGHLNNLLKTLEEEGAIGSISEKSGKSYFVQSGYERRETPLIKSLRSSYRTFVSSAKMNNFEDFLEIITTAFSSYGITTFDNLFKKKNSSYLNLENVVGTKKEKITDVPFETFKEGIFDFFESESDETVNVKVGLAQTYMAMKMMGAGNWESNEFHELLDGKKVLLDSNILFSFLSAEGNSEKNFIFDSFQILRTEYSVEFHVAAETLQEFRRAFHSQLIELEKASNKSANIGLYKDAGVLDLDWFDSYLNFKKSEPESSFDDFAQYISAKIDRILDALKVTIVHLETGDDSDVEKLQNYQDKISELLVQKKRLPKSERALLHDSQVALYLEENTSITFFSYDSCWRHLRINGDVRYLNCGDLLLYMTIGTANSKELSQLLSHVIKENILPFKSFFTLRDIESLRNFEEKVAMLSRTRKRELSSRLKILRREKIEKGADISSEEITRTAFHYLCEISDNEHEAQKISLLHQQLKERDQSIVGVENEKSDLKLQLTSKDTELQRLKSFIYPFLGVSALSLIFHLVMGVSLGWTSIGPGLLLLHFFFEGKFGLSKYWAYAANVSGVVIPVVTLILSQAEKKEPAAKVIVEVVTHKDELTVTAAAPKRVKKSLERKK